MKWAERRVCDLLYIQYVKKQRGGRRKIIPPVGLSGTSETLPFRALFFFPPFLYICTMSSPQSSSPKLGSMSTMSCVASKFS